MQNTFDILNNLFQSSPLYLDQNGAPLKNKIIEDAQSLNPELIKLLLKDKNIKKTFFTKVDDILVFDKVKFARFLDNKEFLPDSFTAYKNKIGLTANGNFISSTHDVVLDFPYKDCILEGGQTKDDQKRAEIFYNETLAPDQVTNLLSPKCFCNAKKYDKKGAHDISKIEENDNLIIKGNNLIALSCLLERYRGKVKCIYIDPPYNTGSDSFGYNDSFNHSTWLVFMKNRLELARKLLRDDGAIYVQCDDNEQAYLKVLMDEIFGRENCLNTIIWRYRTYQGQVKDFFPRKHDIIFWYKKEHRPSFRLSYQNNYKDTVDYTRWLEFYNEDKIIYPNYPKTDSRFTAYLDKYIKEHGKPKNGDIIYTVKGYVVDDVWEDIKAIDAKDKDQKTIFKGGQKPEELIERILYSVTNKGDLILDFHLGSGTTAAVAHKMGRQYIGIEQMDYIETVTVERLKKVIAGEQGGISKSQNWTGGGSFVYCELAKQNATFIDKINSCKTEKEIAKIIQEILKSDFVSSKVVPSEINTAAEDFKELSLDDKKKFAIALLDKNLLYVNKTEINDTDNSFSQNDKEFTKSFYS